MKIFFAFFLFSSVAFSQNYVSVNQSVKIQQSVTVVNDGPNFSFVAYELAAWRNLYDNKKRREEARQRAQSQIAIIKSAYSEASSFPEMISDGWHQVVATDNFSYCSPAKAFIQNNKITQFVLGDWTKLSRNFNILSAIKNGKAIIAADLQDGNLETVELYFMNDLTEPQVATPPMESAYICFYSDCRKAKSTKVWFEGKYYGELKKQFKEGYVPECDERGTLLLEVRPGTSYSFKAAGKGAIHWEGSVIGKENMCLKYVLNKENQLE